jgi:MFS family permease
LKGTGIKKPDLRQFFSGLLPLFIFAHFGHHVVGAMLRPLMPMIRTDLDLSYTEAGVVMSAFAITSGISQLPAGWLADRFGPRIMVALGVSGVAIAGLLIGLSQSYWTLIVFLVIAALLGGGYHPASATAISAVVPQERRGRALGLHLVGGSSSFWVVPLLAAPIALAWGWRGVYLTLSIPAIILGIVLYILIGRRTRVRDSECQTDDVEVPKAPDRIHWRQILPFIIISVTTGTMIQSASAYLSLYAVDHLGVAEATAAMLVAVTPAVGLVAAPLGGYLSDRFGGIPVIIIVSFVAGPLVYLLGLVPNVPALVAVMISIGFVSNTRMPTSEAYIVGNIPEHRRSTILGFYFFAGAEIAGLMTPVMGNLIDRLGFVKSFNIISASIASVAVVCSLLLWRNRASAGTPGLN